MARKKSKTAVKKAVKKPLYKVLYKRFDSVHDELQGPYSLKQYFNKDGEILTLKNAIGFKSVPVKGRLQMCWIGYHASEKQYLREFWGNVIYKIRLYGAVKRTNSDNKWYGRSFTILKRVK